MDKRYLKLAFLLFAKFSGMFWLARLFSRQSLRILCYHGFSLSDEHEFRPKLFMKPEDFERRMEWLRRHGFPVIALDQGVAALKRGGLPRDAVVITMDDGFVGVRIRALPVLRKFGYPATVYVTTYYVQRQQPLFNIVVQYLFWLTGRTEVEIPQGRFDWIETCKLLRDMPSEDRPAVIGQLGDAFGVDIGRFMHTRVFHLMTFEELAELDRSGVNIQLHTHRHRWSLGDERANAKEIAENKAVLEPLVSRPLVHLCYPAGQFTPAQYDSLAAMGIESAMTLEPGLNLPGAQVLALHRIIDGSNVTTLEFEAEISGYMDILRRIGRAVRTIWRDEPIAAAQPAAREAA